MVASRETMAAQSAHGTEDTCRSSNGSGIRFHQGCLSAGLGRSSGSAWRPVHWCDRIGRGADDVHGYGPARDA